MQLSACSSLIALKEIKYTRKEVAIGRCRLRDCYRIVDVGEQHEIRLVVVVSGRSQIDTTEQNVLDFWFREEAVEQGNGGDSKDWALVREANDIDLGR